MYLYIYIYDFLVYKYIYIHICVYIYILIYIYICFTYIYVCAHVCACVRFTFFMCLCSHRFFWKTLIYISRYHISFITCTFYSKLNSILIPYGPAVRVFANGPGDLGSIPGRVIPKTLKMVLDTTLLNTQHYKVRFKGKVEQFWEWSSASPTPWCSSYRKGSLRVTLDYGR